MQLIKAFTWLTILAGVIHSCIEPYSPEFTKDEINTLVISGGITNQEGYNRIYVSLATSLGQPEFFPVVGCKGSVSDNLGNIFTLQDGDTKGEYKVWIGKEMLLEGKKFKLNITSPTGLQYESDEEEMPVGPVIDTAYYAWEMHQTANPVLPEVGIQFYINLHASPEQARYYRYEVVESWEYHSPFPMEWYYDGKSQSIKSLEPPDYSKMVCFQTKNVNRIYTLNTSNFISNSFIGFPLHFIENTNAKLLYSYSVLIRQEALSESSYQYWEYLRQNIEDQEGLYQKQPLQIKGNIRSLSEPGRRILGNFTVSALQTKRITLTNIENIQVDLSGYCRPWIPKSGGLGSYLKSVGWGKIVYLVKNDTGTFLADASCFDCRILGGTTTKPAFFH